MGTKNNPGAFDCYANAEPDEPMFTLLGRDPMAPLIVTLWAEMRALSGEDAAKCKEARDCAIAMFRWAITKGKGERVLQAGDLLVKALDHIAGHHEPAP